MNFPDAPNTAQRQKPSVRRSFGYYTL